MSKKSNRKVEAKVDATPNPLVDEAKVYGLDPARIEALIAAGFEDDARALVESEKARISAETEAKAAARRKNRYSGFFSAVVTPLRKGKLPNSVENRENAISLIRLVPERGDDFKSRYAAKDLFALYAAGFLRPEVVRAIDALAAGEVGKGKGWEALKPELRDPVLALIPENVRKAVGIETPKA